MSFLEQLSFLPLCVFILNVIVEIVQVILIPCCYYVVKNCCFYLNTAGNVISNTKSTPLQDLAVCLLDGGFRRAEQSSVCGRKTTPSSNFLASLQEYRSPISFNTYMLFRSLPRSRVTVSFSMGSPYQSTLGSSGPYILTPMEWMCLTTGKDTERTMLLLWVIPFSFEPNVWRKFVHLWCLQNIISGLGHQFRLHIILDIYNEIYISVYSPINL